MLFSLACNTNFKCDESVKISEKSGDSILIDESNNLIVILALREDRTMPNLGSGGTLKPLATALILSPFLRIPFIIRSSDVKLSSLVF